MAKFDTKSARWLRSIGPVAMMTILSSCSTHQDKYGSRSENIFDAFMPAGDYESLFEHKTQEKRTHSEFEPVLTAFITPWDADLREKYVLEMRNRFRLPEDEEKKLAQEQLLEDDAYFVFVLSAATREPAWNDFQGKSSMWRMTLENSDSSIQESPVRIENISQKDETARFFYRHANPFTNTYKVYFPKKALREANKILFHISGTRGALVAEFKNSSRGKE